MDLRRLAAVLPKPRFEGYQARSAFRQSMFSPTARGWWVGMQIKIETQGDVEVRMSARVMLDLLAGRISPEQFRREVGERDGDENWFRLWLDQGKTLSGVTVESGGLDKDDHYLVLRFSDDPAARPLRLPPSST